QQGFLGPAARRRCAQAWGCNLCRGVGRAGGRRGGGSATRPRPGGGPPRSSPPPPPGPAAAPRPRGARPPPPRLAPRDRFARPPPPYEPAPPTLPPPKGPTTATPTSQAKIFAFIPGYAPPISVVSDPPPDKVTRRYVFTGGLIVNVDYGQGQGKVEFATDEAV